MDIKDFWQLVLRWFHRRNLVQKGIWLAYLIAFIYAFFATPTSRELFSFIIVSLPIMVVLDRLLSK